MVAITVMTHIAIAELLDGGVFDWKEPVGDEQYQAGMSNKAVPTPN